MPVRVPAVARHGARVALAAAARALVVRTRAALAPVALALVAFAPVALAPVALALVAFALVALATPRAPLAAQAPVPVGGRPITLAEALARARAVAPAIVQARGTERTAVAARRAAFASFVPSLTANASATENLPVTPRVNPSTGELIVSRWAASQGLNLGVDLFDGFSRLATVRGARAGLDAAAAGLAAEDATLGLAVKQQFFASLGAREAERAAEEQLRLAEEQLRASRVRVAAQAATRSDSLRAALAVQQARLAIATARGDRDAADAALARLVGSTAPVTADSAGLPDPRALAADSAALLALADVSPAVRQAEAQGTAAREQVRVAKAGWLPTLSVSYLRNRIATGPEFEFLPANFNYNTQLRFNVAFPLFNQWQREQGIAVAEAQASVAAAQARDLRLAARQQVQQALAQLRTALVQLEVQEASVVAAEEDLRVQRQRYELGAALQLDVQTSQNALAAARLALVQARFAARLARAQLEAATGRPL